jgi:hypothetical protein
MGLTARWGRPEEAAASGEDVRQLKCEGRSVIAGLMFVNRQRYPFVTARDDDASARVRARMLGAAERRAKAALAEAERVATTSGVMVSEFMAEKTAEPLFELSGRQMDSTG